MVGSLSLSLSGWIQRHRNSPTADRFLGLKTALSVCEMAHVDHEFVWPNACSVVRVTGSWCGWDDGVLLKPQADGKHTGIVSLPAGVKHTYKFIVDGQSTQCRCTCISCVAPACIAF